MKRKILASMLGLSLVAGMTDFVDVNIFPKAHAEVVNVNEYDIDFDATRGVEKSMTIDGRTVKFIAYENLVYVKNPANVETQVISIYIPSEYLNGGTVNGYTAKTAPIFMPNGVGGYMPGSILQPTEKDKFTQKPNATLTALSRGLVVAAPAIRGRTTVTNGVYVGKAPAFIVDYKAAVRYLRHNKNKLPAGDTEKIISNGTSAGGALSAALGSTGNAPDFKVYLDEIGAADERDDIFAASVYCPITNLENADKAYEWIFYGENIYYPAMWQIEDLKARGVYKGKSSKPSGKIDANSANNPVASSEPVDMTKEEIAVSKVLRDEFPAYVNGLNLRDAAGKKLTLDKNGNGTFKDFIKAKYIESAQSAVDAGKDLSKETWIKIRNGKVIDVDLAKYPAAVTRMKAAPAFDKADLSSAENDEFGTTSNKPRHFSETYKVDMADVNQIRIMNPLNFIGQSNVNVAKHFRIRHGSADRDTALAIPAILALKLQENGVDVNFFSPFGQGHGGDYDLEELFDWIDSICK